MKHSQFHGVVKTHNDIELFKQLAYRPFEAESLHRLLLATVDDVRAVVIKLAFRIQRLRGLQNESDRM